MAVAKCITTRKITDRALADYSEAITLDPNNAKAHIWTGTAGNAYYENDDRIERSPGLRSGDPPQSKVPLPTNAAATCIMIRKITNVPGPAIAKAITARSDNAAPIFGTATGEDAYFDTLIYDRALADQDRRPAPIQNLRRPILGEARYQPERSDV